jgi:thiol:disulfide interchange protein
MLISRTRRGIVLLFACTFAAVAGGCSGINWERDQQAGLQKAVQSRQRAVIEFVAAFDEGANQMDSEVFSDPDVVKLMRRFVAIRLDWGSNKQFADQFGVQGTPAFVVVRPDLSVAGQYEGTMRSRQFQLFLIRNSLN